MDSYGKGLVNGIIRKAYEEHGNLADLSESSEDMPLNLKNSAS